MNNQIFSIYRDMKATYCDGCDLYKECRNDDDFECGTKDLLNRISVLEVVDTAAEEEGCFICNNKGKEIFFDDGRGGFRTAQFCPHCGRKIG